MRKYLTEGVGTFILVFFGVGSVVFNIDQIGVVGIALTFGLLLLVLAYAIGPVTGAHVNPAVTLGALLSRRIALVDAAWYWGAQVVGAIAAAALIKALVAWGAVTDQSGALGTTGWGEAINVGGALVVEIALTFLLVLVVLLVTGRTTNATVAGVAIGLVLAVIHLVGVPLTGASVNPARSIGPALFEGGEALRELWLFIVAPLIGGALAALVAPFVSEREGPTRLARDSGPVSADEPRRTAGSRRSRGSG
jgi:aquaporin Z